MGTGTFRPAVLLVSVALSIVAAGCGGKTKAAQTQATAPPSSAAFAWLSPAAPPAAWGVAPISSGAKMPYPPGWQLVRGDRGTATAILNGADHRILGYLNVTPRQAHETAASWAHFRVEHNGEEGDRQVKALAVATGLRFRTGHGACIRDSYTTKTGAHYIEIACLVAAGKRSSVIVGASPPSAWSQISPVIERAISGFTT